MEAMPAERTYSIGEMRRTLPRVFLEGLSGEFPPQVVDRILRGMGARRPMSLRVNALKMDARELIGFFNKNAVKHRRVQWYPDAFILPQSRERDAEKWAPYREGRLYLQSLSSMIPALALAPKPGESVLDLTAAPGSKTTQMAAIMGNRGFILANDSNPLRAERLAYNLRLQGCTAARVRVGRGERLGAEMPERFDRVLLDAPCSGEGRFTAADPSTYRSWSPRVVGECERLQRRLMASAVRALKPGGTLVYSTCTLNRRENELTVHAALETHPLELEELAIDVPSLVSCGAEGLDPSLRKAARILPNGEFEGFFLCRMRKTRG
jgi:NOL1/NOP2/sun family putative RNA methylase